MIKELHIVIRSVFYRILRS